MSESLRERESINSILTKLYSTRETCENLSIETESADHSEILSDTENVSLITSINVS